MAVRQDQVQLKIDFITDESRALAKTLLQTKEYTAEIEKSTAKVKQYQNQIAAGGKTEQQILEIKKKITAEEANIAANVKKVYEEGKKVEKLDLSKITPSQLVERARQLALAMRQIPQSAPEFRVLQAELAKVNTQLKQVNDTAKGGGAQSGGGLFGGISNLLANGPRAIPIIGTIVAGFQALGGAFSGADKLEQLTISFETFLGSADKAKAVIKDLRQFADVTPFETEQVNKAGRALLAFGFTTKELIPTLTKIGDIAAGTGKDFNELALIYGKAKTQGLIQGEELNQLAEAGIPIYAELAKVLGVNESQIRKLGEQGKIQFKDLEKVFQNLAGEGGKFAGLMEKQSHSLGGLYSTLKSALSNLLTEVGTTLAPLAKGGMELLINAVGILSTVITPVFKAFGFFFSESVEGAKSLFSWLGDKIPGAISGMVRSAESIPVLGKGLTLLLAPIRLVVDAFESLSATAEGVFAGLADIFATGGQNVGKAYGEARNKALAAEREIDARDASREAAYQRELEQDALEDARIKAAKEDAVKRQKEREEAQKRLDAALAAALSAVEVHNKRQELFLENSYVKGQISEAQYQDAISDITREGLERRLDVYKNFHKELSNEALAIQNQLAAAAHNESLKTDDLLQLPTRTPGQVTSIAPKNQVSQDLAIQAQADAAKQFALKSRFEKLLITEQDYELKRLELKRAALAEEIELLKLGTEEEVALAGKKANQLYALDTEIEKKRADNAKKTAEFDRKVQQAGLAATADLFSVAADLLLEDEKARKKHASAIKAFQIAQVLTSGILEVQKIWASVAEFGPAAPIIGGLLTGVAVARAALAIGKISKQKFAGGGYTGTSNMPADSTGHRPVGVVHENEYVIPSRQVNDPQVAPVVHWLENRRVRGFAAGGLVTVNTTPSSIPGPVSTSSSTFPGMQQFNDVVAMLAGVVANFPRESRARVVITDLEDRQSELDSVRDAASI